MNRKVQIVRAWAAAAAFSLLGIWEPSMWFGIVPLFFFPSCLCCGTPCTCCDPTTVPSTYQIDTSGFTNGLCTSCANYNGSFIATQDFSVCEVTLGISGCCWVYTMSSGYCVNPSGSDIKYIGFGLIRTGDVDLRVMIYDIALTPVHLKIWEEASISPDPDCSAFSARSVPHFSSHARCTHDSSSATVTAL